MDAGVNKTTSKKGYHRRSTSQKQNQKGSQQQSSGRDQSVPRENKYNRNSRRDGHCRQSYVSKSTQSRYRNRVKAEETIDDIKEDIVRIEKEIELEMKEIRSLKLGL
jgi:CCR4-NOT transcriptional regulation complex NOT5 subunit